MIKYEIGDIFTNKKGEKFEIISVLDSKNRIIKFLNTGFEKKIQIQSIRAKGVTDESNSMYSVGKIFKNKFGSELKVLEELTGNKRKIKFLDKYGYERVVTTGNIYTGQIKNPYDINVYSVGCIGEYPPSKNIENGNKIYELWRGMIRRCYYDLEYYKNSSYKNTCMCDEWLNFSNFHKWAVDNYISGFVLDKDLLQLGMDNKVYGLETCIFIPENVNNFITSKLKQKNPYFRKGKYEVRAIEFGCKKSISLGSYSDLEIARSNIYNFEIKQIKIIIDYLINLEVYSEDIILKLNKIKNNICNTTS